MKWPIIITALRFIVFTVAAMISVYWLSTGIVGIFYSSAFAMILFGALMVLALKRGAWRKA
jgi:Na+-driven multidrug efflux pump